MGLRSSASSSWKVVSVEQNVTLYGWRSLLVIVSQPVSIDGRTWHHVCVVRSHGRDAIGEDDVRLVVERFLDSDKQVVRLCSSRIEMPPRACLWQVDDVKSAGGREEIVPAVGVCSLGR